MNPQWQSFTQGYKTIGRDPGPWVTQRNNELNAQAVRGMVNTPRFKQIMNNNANPVLSKTSPQLQGPGGPLTEEELQQQAVQQMFRTPKFQQIMKRGPILAKDSPRLMPDDNGPYKPPTQEVQYMDPILGSLAVTGMNYAATVLEGLNKKKDTYNRLGDRVGTVVPNGGDEGTYTWNQHFYRPKDYVVTQFGAVPRGPRAMAAEGGVIEDQDVVVPDVAANDVFASDMPALDVFPSEVSASPIDVDAPGYFDSEVRGGADLVDSYELPDVSEMAFDASDAVDADGTNPKKGKKLADRLEPDMSVKLNKNTYKAFDYLVGKKKLSPIAAAAIAGNTWWESGNDATMTQRGGGPGTGILQWTDALKLREADRAKAGDRWNDLVKWAKKRNRNPYSLETQLDYILEEPGWGGSELLAKLAEADTPEKATMIFGRTNVRPRESTAEWAKRMGAARKLYEEYLRRMNGPRMPPRIPMPNENVNTALNEQATEQELMNEGLVWNDEVFTPEGAEGEVTLERGGEYLVTPKQLKFILANGGEVEFL